jgi:hypothetical protein
MVDLAPVCACLTGPLVPHLTRVEWRTCLQRQNFKTLRQPLLGELAMSRKKERKRKNKIYSEHLHFCLQPKGSARTPLGPIYFDYKVFLPEMCPFLRSSLVSSDQLFAFPFSAHCIPCTALVGSCAGNTER